MLATVASPSPSPSMGDSVHQAITEVAKTDDAKTQDAHAPTLRCRRRRRWRRCRSRRQQRPPVSRRPLRSQDGLEEGSWKDSKIASAKRSQEKAREAKRKGQAKHASTKAQMAALPPPPWQFQGPVSQRTPYASRRSCARRHTWSWTCKRVAHRVWGLEVEVTTVCFV